MEKWRSPGALPSHWKVPPRGSALCPLPQPVPAHGCRWLTSPWVNPRPLRCPGSTRKRQGIMHCIKIQTTSNPKHTCHCVCRPEKEDCRLREYSAAVPLGTTDSQAWVSISSGSVFGFPVGSGQADCILVGVPARALRWTPNSNGHEQCVRSLWTWVVPSGSESGGLGRCLELCIVNKQNQ